MNLNRRRFALSLSGLAGGLLVSSKAAAGPQASAPGTLARAQGRLVRD